MYPEQRQPLNDPTQQFAPVPQPGPYPSGQYAPSQYPPLPPAQGYYAPPVQAPPAPPVQAKSGGRARKVGAWILGGLVALFVIAGISGGRDDQPTTVTEVPAAVAGPAPAAPAAVEAAPAPEPAAPEGIGDGTHIVGVDIEPGTYRSAGATPGLFELCMWSTKDGPSSNSNIIDLGTANADEQQVVEIGSGVEAFESSGCDTWQRVE